MATPFDPSASLVVHNPVSGRARGRRRAARLVARLAERGFLVEPTRGPGDATEIATRAAALGRRALVVVGGDGTLFEAIERLPPEVALAHFPTGTVNLMARALKIPARASPWLALLDRGRLQRVHFGRCNGRPFASVGSAGFDALVVAHVNRRVKKWIQEGAYGLRALVELPRYRPPDLTVTVDGRAVDGPLVGVVVGKGPYFGGPHRILPGADPRLPTFRVALLAGRGRSDLLRYGGGMLLGTLPSMRGVTSIEAREVTVDGRPDCHVQLDGEAFGTTPATFEVEPEARLVLAPGG